MAHIPTAEHENTIFEPHEQGEDSLGLERMRDQGRKRDASVQTTGGNYPPLKRRSKGLEKLNASTQTTTEDFLQATEDGIIPQETTQEANAPTAETELNVVDQVIYEENNSAFMSESSEQNRERELSVDQLITHDRDSHNPSRLEISGGREEGITPFREQGDINPDLTMDTSTTSNQIEMNTSCLIDPESRDNTEAYSDDTEPYSDNEEMQEFDSSANRVETTAASNMNVSENDSEISNGKNEFSVDDNVPSLPSASLCPENSPESNLLPSASLCPENSPESNLSVQPKRSPLKLQATEEAAASNMNISQNENLPGKFSEGSNREGEF